MQLQEPVNLFSPEDTSKGLQAPNSVSLFGMSYDTFSEESLGDDRATILHDIRACCSSSRLSAITGITLDPTHTTYDLASPQWLHLLADAPHVSWTLPDGIFPVIQSEIETGLEQHYARSLVTNADLGVLDFYPWENLTSVFSGMPRFFIDFGRPVGERIEHLQRLFRVQDAVDDDGGIKTIGMFIGDQHHWRKDSIFSSSKAFRQALFAQCANRYYTDLAISFYVRARALFFPLQTVVSQTELHRELRLLFTDTDSLREEMFRKMSASPVSGTRELLFLSMHSQPEGNTRSSSKTPDDGSDLPYPLVSFSYGAPEGRVGKEMERFTEYVAETFRMILRDAFAHHGEPREMLSSSPYGTKDTDKKFITSTLTVSDPDHPLWNRLVQVNRPYQGEKTRQRLLQAIGLVQRVFPELRVRQLLVEVTRTAAFCDDLLQSQELQKVRGGGKQQPLLYLDPTTALASTASETFPLIRGALTRLFERLNAEIALTSSSAVVPTSTPFGLSSRPLLTENG